jgi:hypothetical protein
LTEREFAMLPEQSRQGLGADQDRFQMLCSEVEEYEHLPELTPGATSPQRMMTGTDHEETIDASILAGLTLP